MLEIMFLIMLCNTNRANALKRGRKPGGYVGLTVALWLLPELLGVILGLAADLGYVAYLLGISCALVGGLISYLVAKNAAPGNYTSPDERLLRENQAQNAALAQPARILLSREKSFVAAMASWEILLNGQSVGLLKNGGQLSLVTEQQHNLLQAKDGLGSSAAPYSFDVPAGGTAEIFFKVNRFLPERSRGLLPPGSSAPRPGAAAIEPSGSRRPAYCTECGSPLLAEAAFCTQCGSRVQALGGPNQTQAQIQTQAISGRAAEARAYARHEAAGAERFWPACLCSALLFFAWLLIYHILPPLTFRWADTGLLHSLSGIYAANILMGAQFAVAAFLIARRRAVAAIAGSLIALCVPLFGLFLHLFDIQGATGLRHGFIYPLLSAVLVCLITWLLSFRRSRPEAGRRGSVASYGLLAGLLPVELYRLLAFLFTSQASSASLLVAALRFLILMPLLFFTPPFLEALCRRPRARLRPYGIGLVWCWLACIGPLLSIVLPIARQSGPVQLAFSLCACAAYGLMLGGKRAGFYLLLASVSVASIAQLLAALYILFDGDQLPLALSALLVAVAALINLLFGWLALRAADKREQARSAQAAWT